MTCYLTLTSLRVYMSITRGVISGAITSQYLLEKSRIVFQVKLNAHTRTCMHRHTNTHMGQNRSSCLLFSELTERRNLKVRVEKSIKFILSISANHAFIRILHLYEHPWRHTHATWCTNMDVHHHLCTYVMWTCFCPQAKSERNYHIFYEMLAGLPPNEKHPLYLQEAETYYYLNQVGF